ncbi:MAG TPA: hypothetical protein PKH39_17790 [Woeseiaceae bacterium]|nr:hypothetical protein [Woeseiaceae bacterium]
MFMIAVLIGVLLSPVFIMGALIIVVGLRFKKNMKKKGDVTAFWSNWIAFIWAWAEQAESVVELVPHFRRDLTETFGYRPDDGRVT